jgi:hypothetical protein
MTRFTGAACSVLLLLGLAGCGDDDSTADATTTTAERGSTTTVADGPTLFDQDVAGFEQREVTFANLTYWVMFGIVSFMDIVSFFVLI